jgi:hypothetical protein
LHNVWLLKVRPQKQLWSVFALHVTKRSLPKSSRLLNCVILMMSMFSCAVAAGADAIVTGDKDLLVLDSFEGIPIMNAQEALQRLFSLR